MAMLQQCFCFWFKLLMIISPDAGVIESNLHMKFLANPSRKGLLALDVDDSIKFLHLDPSSNEYDGVLTKNDFNLTSATLPDLPQHVDSWNINCMTWCCLGKSTNPISLAVGLENGSVYMLWPSYPESSTSNHILLYQASRSCKALAWNKMQPEYLAFGFDKSRSEFSLIVTNLLKEGPKKEHVTGLIDNKLRGQTESCFSEAVNSIMWSDREPRTLVAGVNGKFLRLYDMRSFRTASQVVNTKSVFGLCQDPCLDSRFASFYENQINVWDLRSFSKPAATISTRGNVIKADWCPTRNGFLATISSGSGERNIVRVYDTSHAVVTDSESDIVYRHVEQIVKLPLNASEKTASIAWLPYSENRLVAVTDSGIVHRMKIPERISLNWTNQSELVTACKHIHQYFGKQKQASDAANLFDIEQIIYKRSKNGYGLDHSKDHGNSKVNLEPDNTSLRLFWKWIKLAKESYPISVMKDTKPNLSHGGRPPWGRSASSTTVLNSRFCGLQKELKQTSSTGVSFSIIGVPSSSCSIYSSEHRRRALNMCDWYSIYQIRKDSTEFKMSLSKLKNLERAAVLALWHLDMQLAISILKNCNGDMAYQYAVVAMAFSGYAANDTTPLWREMCDNLQRDMPSPYFRAAFAFLKALKEPKIDFRSILKMREVSISDRIGFACMYLDDESLSVIMDELSDDAAKNGCLDGIIATGLTTDLGIELLQAYIDRTKDVQTAALGLIQGGSSDITRNQNAGFIINSYRKLLDLWQLWKERAWFDTVLGKPNSSQRSEYTYQGISVLCNFCGKGIMHPKFSVSRGRGIKIQGSGNASKPISCPQCRKPLPRCSICCLGLGTSQADSEFEDDPYRDGVILENSFTWCSSCQHGGHRQHIKEWFTAHNDCPVSGCLCDCRNCVSALNLLT